MAATILNSPRAVEVSVFVVRAFVRLSRVAGDQRRFALKLAEIEAKLATHDRSFQVVFATIKQLMQPPAPKKKRIGFITDDDKPAQTGSGSDFIARDRPRHRTRR
jgi:multidrug resistance efflux pump